MRLRASISNFNDRPNRADRLASIAEAQKSVRLRHTATSDRRPSMRSTSIYKAASILALVFLCVTSIVRADSEHRVREGQTLNAIARRYHVSPRAIAQANRLRSGARLRIGQILVIPNGASGPSSSRTASSGEASSWGRPRNPGLVSFQRLGTRETYRGRLVDPRGRARNDARRRLSRLMRDDDGGVRLPNPRLLAVLTRISDHFGGRKIHIVSGYRRPGGYTRDTSRHTHGDAMDLRIEGVPITAIRDYCRSLANTGCGYYPRSRFVHVDVRDRPTYWVDWSGPGEAPSYRRPAGASDAAGDGTDADGTDAEGESAAEGEGAESGVAPATGAPETP